MVKFKNEMMRVIREIEKREDDIRTLKRLKQNFEIYVFIITSKMKVMLKNN